MFSRREARPGGKDKALPATMPSTITLLCLAVVVGIAGGLTSGIVGWMSDHPGDVQQRVADAMPSGVLRSGATTAGAPAASAAAGSGGHPVVAAGEASAILSHAVLTEGFPDEVFKLRVVEMAPTYHSHRWFMVDNSELGSDDIIKYLQDHEGHVMSAFSLSLDPKACGAAKAMERGFGVCSPGPDTAGRIWMADVGSNSGFYGLMAGALGYPTVFMEPQPHCAQYVRASVLASGFGERARVMNSFAGDTSKASFDTVQRRTGCWGTFPYLTAAQLEGLSGAYKDISGWKDKIAVPMLRLDDVVLGPEGGPQRDVVLGAMKVDVEGSEVAMMGGARRLLEQGRIFNIVMELNKPAWRSAKIDPVAKVIPMLMSLDAQGFRCHFSNRGSWSTQTDMDMSAAALTAFLEEGWLSLDMWCTLPTEKRHVLK